MADFGKTLVNFGKEVLFDSLPEAVPVLKGRKDLEYPLNNPDDYKGRLMFSIFEEEPLDMAALVGLSGIFAKDSDTSEITNDGEQTEEFKGEGVAYQTKEGSGSKLSQIDKSVKLFTPVALQFRDNVAYDNADLGFGGGIGEAAGKSGKNILSSLLGGVGSTLSAGLQGNAGGDLGKLAMTQVSVAKVAGEGANLAVKQAAGVTMNPNTRALFKSVALREFAFTFKFIATSEREADEIDEIIKFFRTELYPEDILVDIGGVDASIGYRFPNKFNIAVVYDGKEIATKIQPCFLRDISITYNPTNSAMHSGGKFTEIDMTLAFTETSTLNRKKVEEEGY